MQQNSRGGVLTIGVYKIEHVPSGRFYVGSSNNVERRFYEHRSELSLGTHHCRALMNIWRKHGASTCTFEIIKVCLTHVDALAHEQEWLDEHHGSRLCLNGSSIAFMPILSPESRKNQRLAVAASKFYKESHRRVCLERNADPEFQKRATEALRKSEKHKTAVRKNAVLLQRPEIVAKTRNALRNSENQKSAARRQCIWLNTDPVILAKNRATTSRPVIGVHITTGESLRFPSQSEAARYLGVRSIRISENCKGSGKSVKGFKWNVVMPAGVNQDANDLMQDSGIEAVCELIQGAGNEHSTVPSRVLPGQPGPD